MLRALLNARDQGGVLAPAQFVWLRGTPGVGKSYFLDYVLSELMKRETVESEGVNKCKRTESESVRVLVISGPQNKATLFESHESKAKEYVGLDQVRANTELIASVQ